jgi:uncharacterized membrane protein YgdD (TMEM256/DUF423 family)
MRVLIAAASVCGLLLVAAGAAGAHTVPIEATRQWDSALLFGLVHTLAALAAAAVNLRTRMALLSGWVFVAGVLMFAGVQVAKLLTAAGGASPFDALTMLVPVGGIAFMLGWGLLAIAALMPAKES